MLEQGSTQNVANFEFAHERTQVQFAPPSSQQINPMAQPTNRCSSTCKESVWRRRVNPSEVDYHHTHSEWASCNDTFICRIT